MAYEPTLDEVLNSIYGPESDLTEEELAQYLPEPYTAPQYAPQDIPVPQGRTQTPVAFRQEAPKGRVKTAVNQSLSPEARALLDTIAGDESPDYRTVYGGRKVNDLSWHPGIAVPIRSGPNAGQTSSAAGRYQFLGSTWNNQAKKLGLSDFSPESQDLAAWGLALESYGPSLEADLRSGDPAKIARVGHALRKVWTSLPGGIEQGAQASKFASRYFNNLGAESGNPQAAPQESPQPQQSPYQTVKLSDGTTVDVEPGADLSKLAEILKTNGIDAEPLRQVSLPDGSYVDAPLSYSDEQVLQGMRKIAPDAFGEQAKSESDKKGVLPAMISGAESAFGSMARGAGAATEKAGQYLESPWLQEKGRLAAEEGREWQQKAAERYQELTPEEAKQMGMWGTARKEFVEPLASGVGSIGATLPAFMIPGVGMAAGVGAIGAQEIGGELAEQERMGQTPDVTKTLGPAAVSTAVNVAGMRFLGPLKGLLGEFASPSAQAYIKDKVAKEGVEAASAAIGSRMSNILKETGLNVAGVGTGEVASRIAERVASDQPIDTPEALAEYEDVFLKSAPLGVVSGGLSGAGRYAAKKGTVEEAQLAQKQQELEAARAAEAEKAQTVENEAAQKRIAEEAELERKAGIGVEVRPSEEPAAPITPPTDTTVPPLEPQEPPTQPTIPTEELPAAPVLPDITAAPTAEVAPEVAEKAPEVIPEPTIRQPEPKHWAEEMLGLPPKAGLVKKLKAQNLNIDNPADHEAITDIISKTQARIEPQNYQRLEAYMDQVAAKQPEISTPEVPSAQRVQEPAEVNAGSIPQPEIRQEGRGATEGGEGVRISRPEIGQVEEIQVPEAKLPQPEVEAVAPLTGTIPTLATLRTRLKDSPAYKQITKTEGPPAAKKWLDNAVIKTASQALQIAETNPRFSEEQRLQVRKMYGPTAARLSEIETVKTPEVPAAPKIKAPKVETPEIKNLYNEALQHVQSTGVASISGLQRKLKVNHKEANELMNRLQQDGYVSAPESNGSRYVLDKKAETPTAQKIEGKTKVVDEQGNPRVMYHGTGDIIKAFDREGLGTHFTSDPKVASAFAESFDEGANVLPVRLDIKNPLRVKDFGGSHSEATFVAEDFIKQGILPKNYVDDAFYARIMKGVAGEKANEIYQQNNAKELSKIRQEIEKQGYDGLVYDNKVEGGGDTYIAFRPEQVESAIGKTKETEVAKLPEHIETWDSLRTPEQPDFASLSKPAQKLWKDEYKVNEGMVGKDAVDDVVKFDAGEKELEIKEARVPSPDKGIRPIAVEDFADTTNARELVQRVKEKGTDADLIALTDTINKSPHLGAVGVKWVKAADKVHSDIRQKFDTGTTAVAAWDENGKPTIYFNSESPNLREDVPVHELVHGVTEAALQRNPEAAAELNRVSRQIHESLDSPELKQFWGEAIKDNPGEVLAYGLTSPTFRETLKQFDSSGNKLIEKPKALTQAAPTRLTLWDKFVDAVSRLFGLPTKRKEAFKQQLNDYLNKKADYESQVKRYNEQRPLQGKLDSTFKSLLRETSKKGVELKESIAKEVKEEVTPKEPKPLVKEQEPEERSILRDGMDAAVNAMKTGLWVKLQTSMVNKSAAMRKYTKAIAEFDENRKLRGDLVASTEDQIFNVITAGSTEGFPVFSTDGSVMIRQDQKKNLSNIRKATDKLNVKNPRSYLGFIARALRGESIMKQDAEAIKRIDELRDKAKKLNEYAKTQSFAEGKAASDLAEKYTKQADKLQDKLGEGGREKLVTAEDIAEAKRRLAEHPEIQPILDDIHGLLKSLVDLWEEGGLITKEVADKWRSDPYYIPLYAAEEDLLRDPSKTVRMMGGGAKSLPNVKALKGGEQAINLFENLQRHYAFMTAAAAQNATRKTAAQNMELVGAARRTSRDDKQAIMFKENGKEVFYHIDDPLALDAFQAAAPLMNPLLKAARGYTKTFRAVTLVNPLYWYRQLIRDPLHANVVSKTGIVTPIGATLSFAKIIAGASKEYGELKRRGVVGAVDSLSDPASFKKISDKNPGLFKKGADWVMHVHEAADAATRVEVYKAALKEAKKKGMSREDAKNYATMRAREIINFANQGRSETLQAIRATVPFFSAALNSLDSVARAATGQGLNRREAAEARRLFVSRALMIASYTTAYALAMQDDEDYINSTDSVNNWLVPTGDKDAPFAMIPIPFELGFFLKVLPELMVRLNSGTLRPSEAKKMAKEAAFSTLMPPMPFPQLIKPLAEAATNTDFHTGQQIVRAGEARKVPTEQTKGASSLSIELGRSLGLSPIQVEHFGRGYLTELWTVMGLVADKFLEEGQGKPAKYAGEVPIVMGGGKGILTKPEKDRDVDTLYETADAVRQIYDTIKGAEGRGQTGVYERLMADPENVKKLTAAPEARKMMDELSAVQKDIDQITNSKMDPDQKQRAIRDRTKWKNELASRFVKRFSQLGIEE